MARKPWGDRDSNPFQGDGDNDGDDNGAFEGGPGEELPNQPHGEPEPSSIRF